MRKTVTRTRPPREYGPLIPVPAEGNYWIFHVDGRYQEAIVGTPDRKYLWLLARTPTIPQRRYAALVAKARQLGFDVARLIQSTQPDHPDEPTTRS